MVVWRVKREGSGKKEKMRDRERETDRQGDWVRGVVQRAAAIC